MGNKTEVTIVRKSFTNPVMVAIDIIAVLVSWYFNHSFWWAILHYMFGPLYLLYSLLIGRFADGGFMTIMNSYF